MELMILLFGFVGGFATACSVIGLMVSKELNPSDKLPTKEEWKDGIR